MSYVYKKWYESKSIWGGLVTLLSIVLGILGYQMSVEEAEAVVLALTGLGATVGTLVGIVGRIKATKEIR